MEKKKNRDFPSVLFCSAIWLVLILPSDICSINLNYNLAGIFVSMWTCSARAFFFAGFIQCTNNHSLAFVVGVILPPSFIISNRHFKQNTQPHTKTKLSGKEEENNVKQPSHSLADDIVCSACLIAPNWTGRAYWFCTTEHTFRIIIKHLQNQFSFTNWIHRINPVFFLSTHTHTHTESHLTLYGSALKPWHFITKTNLRDSKRKR